MSEFQTGRIVDWEDIKKRAIEDNAELDFSEDIIIGVQIYSEKELPKDLSFYFDPYERDDKPFKKALLEEHGVKFYRDQFHSKAAICDGDPDPNNKGEDPLFEGFYSFFIIAQCDMEWEGVDVEEGDIIFAHQWNDKVRVMWMDPYQVKRFFL